LVLATRNEGKLRELQDLLDNLGIEILTLNDFPDLPEIVEDGKSFFENALKKASMVSNWTGVASLADDSGLEIDILEGRPGIYSSRYSGENATDQSNIDKILDELKNVPADQKKANFRCVLVLYKPDGQYDAFEGKLDGFIIDQCCGTQGFGYDPIFFIPELGKTVAQLSPAIKNQISHRAKALRQLKEKLISGESI
jgi:XTP/dITP diphosphohydrolase